MPPQSILTPVVQYGFAGMSSVLLVILVWLVKKILERDERNTIVQQNLIKAIEAIDVRTAESSKHVSQGISRLSNLVAQCPHRGK